MKQKAVKNIAACEIIWSKNVPANWDSLMRQIPRNGLLQSAPYLRAMSKLQNQSVRYGRINMDGAYAGICAVLEVGVLKNAVHAVILDQGPLWFDGYATQENFQYFTEALRKEFPKRLGRRVRFIPHIENTENIRNTLKANGFKPSGNPYKTIWLDTRLDEETRRKNLKKNWAGSLKKAQKSDLQVIWNESGPNLGWLVENYIKDKAAKGYTGATLKTLMALISEFSRGQNLLIGTAMLDGKPVASILILLHGSSATYQIGYTNEAGRKNCAHHVLIWGAMDELQNKDVNYFDLGGINDEDAKGVQRFKTGTGGQMFESPGLWS